MLKYTVLKRRYSTALSCVCSAFFNVLSFLKCRCSFPLSLLPLYVLSVFVCAFHYFVSLPFSRAPLLNYPSRSPSLLLQFIMFQAVLYLVSFLSSLLQFRCPCLPFLVSRVSALSSVFLSLPCSRLSLLFYPAGRSHTKAAYISAKHGYKSGKQHRRSSSHKSGTKHRQT